MAIIQANASPITNKGTIQTVTLKNIVALDVIEKNEALLKAFQLLDDSETKLDLQSTLNPEKLHQLIQKVQSELPSDTNEELKHYKAQLAQEKSKDEDKRLLESLSVEFLANDISEDNTDELLSELQKRNDVKVVIDHTEENPYVTIDGGYLKSKLPTVHDKDSDVIME